MIENSLTEEPFPAFWVSIIYMPNLLLTKFRSLYYCHMLASTVSQKKTFWKGKSTYRETLLLIIPWEKMSDTTLKTYVHRSST